MIWWTDRESLRVAASTGLSRGRQTAVNGGGGRRWWQREVGARCPLCASPSMSCLCLLQRTSPEGGIHLNCHYCHNLFSGKPEILDWQVRTFPRGMLRQRPTLVRTTGLLPLPAESGAPSAPVL